MCATLLCHPSAMPFRRKFVLMKDGQVFATLTKGFLSRHAEYCSKTLEGKIEAHGCFTCISFGIFECNKSGCKQVANYEFSSLRELPKGQIIFESGECYSVRQIAKHDYLLFSEQSKIATFTTVEKGTLRGARFLEIDIEIDVNEHYEYLLFSLWFMMVTVGMGLDAG